jgi:3-deoxy-D-manno-octulosonic-acid transferase
MMGTIDADLKHGRDFGIWLYNLLLVLFSPLVLLWLGWRILVKGKSRVGLRERLGQVPEQISRLAQTGDPVIWFHAVSVGEVGALHPILEAFRLKEPMAHLVLSTTTPTGREMAEKQGTDVEAMFYFPFDLLPIVERTFEAVKPTMLVMVESELWPNVLATAKRRGVKTCVVNARFGDGAFRRAKVLRPLYRWMLSKIDLVCAQSATDAERFVALGAPPDRVRVLGNSKFDERFAAVSEAETARMRQEFGFADHTPVLVAGSTHPGEEEILLDAFSRLCSEFGRLELVLAPRHPERGDKLHELVEKFGFQVYRRSHAKAGHPQPQPAGPQARVVILDTIGELARVYALASVVFVGGSLVNAGGHNILEAIVHGKPALTGPYMHNFRGIFNIALQAGAVEVVRNSDDIVAAVLRFLRQPEEAELRRQRGLAMIQQQRGASERMADALFELLTDGA